MKRAAGIAIAVLALAVLAYAAAGYWLAPRYLRDAMAEAAASRGLDLRVDQVRVHPFALAVELEGVALRALHGRELVAARKAHADFAWFSLLGRRFAVRGAVDDVVFEASGAFHDLVIEAAQRNGPARAAARGRLSLAPFAADLALSAEGIGPAWVRPWLPAGAAPKLASGALALDGRLRDARYEGAIVVTGLQLDSLLSAQRLETRNARVSFEPFFLELGEVVVRAPDARLAIGPDGKVNMVPVLASNGAGKGPRISVRRLRIERGTLRFADRSLDPPFEATIRELEGALTDLGAGVPASLALSGRVEKYGSARIDGTLNLGNPLQHADIRARFRNIDVASLTPYVAKFAGYRVRSGRASAELHYQMRNGELVGDNDLVLRELRLGDKVERAGLKSLPLDLMVALLADAEGRIDLDIPVKGSLNDPEFNFGGLLARALAGAVGKVVSAPFRALAGLLGGGARDADEPPGRIRFAPGSARLSPPQEERVALVAKALAERPGIGVAVRGGYDARRDAGARPELAYARAQAVRTALAAQGVDPARIAIAESGSARTELELSAGAPAASGARVVKAAQRRLNASGFDAGPVDGVLGHKTLVALRAFQQATSLPPSGMLDPATLNALAVGPAG